MKRIFFVFLSIVLTSCFLSVDVSAQEQKRHDASVIQNTAISSDAINRSSQIHSPLARLGVYIHELNQKAAQTNPQQSTDLSQYNVMTPVHLMQTDANPFSGTKGYGDWVDKEFGRVRLISCRSAVTPNIPIWFGVQVELNKGWIIHKPNIDVKTDVPKSFVAYPLQYPLPKGYTQTSFYAQTVIFPIMVHPSMDRDSFQMDVTVDVTAEDLINNKIITESVPLSLLLFDNPVFDTGICPYLKKWIEISALPSDNFVSASATLLENNDIQLFFEFNKKPDFVSVQIESDWSFVEKQNNIQGTFVSYRMTPTRLVPEGEKIPVKVITDIGRFELYPVLSKGDKQLLPQSIPVGQLLLSGLLLVFTTPVWGFFLLHPKKSPPQLKKDSMKTIKVLFLTGVLWCIGLWFHFPDLIQIHPIMCFVFFGCYGLLCWKKHTSLKVVVLGILLLPKPYLYTVLASVDNNLSLFIVCCVWWVWIIIWPFLWWRWYPQDFSKFYHFIFKCKKQASFFVIFPFICMMVWIAGGYINTYLNKTMPIYQENAKNHIINNHKSVLLFVERPVCFQCAWDKVVSLKTGYMRDFTKSGALHIMTVPATSETGKRMKYHFETEKLPMYILYTTSHPDGFFADYSFDMSDWRKLLQ